MAGINIYPKIELTSRNMANIIILIDLNNTRAGRDNINKKINASDWDNQLKQVKDGAANAALINQVIKNTINKHQNFFLKRETLELPITKEIIKAYISKGDRFADFAIYAKEVINSRKTKQGNPLDPDTKRRYLEEIVRMSKFNPTLRLSQIDVPFLESYRDWMQNTFKKKDGTTMHKNGIWKAESFVRMIYKQAVKDKIILSQSDPYASFSVGSFETDMKKTKWLEVFELDKIEQTLLTKEMPYLTRGIGWRFLSMCVTGMRISDAARLNESFINDAGQLEFLPHKTRANEHTACIPLTSDRQRRYIQKALEFPLPQTDPKNFRTTFNNHLRVVAGMAGIRVDVASHQGRHTLGALLVDANIETKPALKILGIKSEKTLKVYQHLKQEKLVNEAEKLGRLL